MSRSKHALHRDSTVAHCNALVYIYIYIYAACFDEHDFISHDMK